MSYVSYVWTLHGNDKATFLKACAVVKGDGYTLNSVWYIVNAKISGTARVNSDGVLDGWAVDWGI